MDCVARTDKRTRGPAVGWVLALCVAALLSACSMSHDTQTADDAMLRDDANGDNWAAYGRTYNENHFSPLTEISDQTVDRLGLVWSIDLPTQLSSHSAPLAIDGVIYYSVGLSHIFAVDAVSGQAKWDYDPQVGATNSTSAQLAWGVRGIAYWDGKIYTGTQDGRLIALDAATGKPVWSVETTKPGDGRYITGAPRVFRGKVIIGHGGADNSALRGYVTAYDAETGKQAWRFYTVPGDPAKGFENEAMEMAAKTWTGEEWKEGGGGTVWNAITFDAELNRIYIGTGNGSPWNARVRSPKGGDNLFLSSIVALEADTGKYLWHYQEDPNETWDRNAAMDIELATLTIGGKPRKVLMHAPKNGFFYVIDRETGKLISAEPFAKQNWAERIDLETGRPVEIAGVRKPDGGPVTVWPSGAGGHSWFAMAFSPQTRLVYIPTIEMAGIFNDSTIDPAHWQRPPGVVVDSSYDPIDFDGAIPKFTESLGHLQAWDPVTQKRVWNVELDAPYNGGVMATGGNLVFQGNMKGKFVAYAADSGKVLWSFDAQNGILAQPITFRVKGRQYITVMTGVGGSAGVLGGLGAPLWDYRAQKRRLLTFALDGKAALPPAPKLVEPKPVEDPDFTVDPALAAQGSKIFFSHCTLCHGPNARSGGAAPDLRASPAILDAGTFSQIVNGGLLHQNGMPSFALSARDLAAVRHYIRTEARK